MPDHVYGTAAVSDETSRKGTTIGQPSALTTFPETPRVIYAKNPLFEVICQLRFPAILKIDSEIPAGFQEKLRASFPLFREEDLLPTTSTATRRKPLYPKRGWPPPPDRLASTSN